MKINTTRFFNFLCLLTIFLASNAFSQNIGLTISGTINQNGKPVEGITVLIKEIQKTAVTDENGRYTFENLVAGKYLLVAKLPNQDAQEMSVRLQHSQKNIDFNFAANSQSLNEVTVSSQRSINQQVTTVAKGGIKNFDLPQSSTIIGSELIQDQQANKLSDIIQNVNGVALGTARAGTSESFYSRGYSLGKNSLLKNGSGVNSAVMPETSTLESVEVLKGSAALLYGNVSSGAVVNMVTKKPKFDFGGEVSLRAGSYDMYKPIVDLYGPISKDLAFRVVSTYENAGSFRNQVKSDKIYVNPSLLYKIGSKTDILVQSDYLKYDNTPDFGIGTLNSKIPTTISRNSFFNTPWAYNKVNQTTVSVTVNHQLNKNWDLNFIGGFQNYDRNYFSTERIQADENGNWARNLTRAKSEENFFNEQINLTGKVKTGKITHTVLFGSDADKLMTQTNGYKSLAALDTINILNYNGTSAANNIPEAQLLTITKSPTVRFGVYAQDLIGLSNKVKLLVGLRWNYQKTDVSEVRNANTQAITNSGTVKTDKAFSPRVGFVYQPSKTVSLYTSYANSFEINSGTDIYGSNLKPSIIDQYEIGVKKELFDGRFSTNLSLYKIINNNFAQMADLNANGTANNDSNIKEFAGQTTSDGLEIDLSGKIANQLNFIAGYSYTFMRYTNSPETNGTYVQGEQLVRNVPHTANGTLFYTFSKYKLKGLKLGASAFYTGNRYAGWNNKIGQTQTESRIIPVKGFTTFDLSAGYNFSKLSLLVKLSNITNELNYIVHENYSVNPIAPRQVSTTLSYKF